MFRPLVAHTSRAWSGLHTKRCLAASLPSRCFSNKPEDRDDLHGEKLLYPESNTQQHSDLASFVAYAKRTDLDVNSTVFKGTHYEYAVGAGLAKYGFHLKRVGGASDYGTDLLGVWTPPETMQRMKVLLQCKAGAQRASPQHVRELEGAFVGAPPGWRGTAVLAFLVSQNPATKGVRDSIGRSRWPMGFICCSEHGRVFQMLWNRRAENEGLAGFSVVAKHVSGEEDHEIALMHGSKILPSLDTMTSIH